MPPPLLKARQRVPATLTSRIEKTPGSPQAGSRESGLLTGPFRQSHERGIGVIAIPGRNRRGPERAPSMRSTNLKVWTSHKK
jgi:hypothetical protein